ncbi:carbon-nitrogen family hydrolase [Streptomyces sp. HB2AG]|uniref:carbon-nitrogen family hydrolase n=1 Tax=Streptomyces sp. HB2AG TaxID=2983400 RepID=UPI0022AA3B83|nr:carbon-nitrogen family hydrolase [Streptomyces sp. HB2AG]MCZ2524729.1 carbon-nitrogen family hydrolase [Streptomyces sp. HB2AG]
MRASLLQIDVDPGESVEKRRARVAGLVREEAGSDLVVLPELWTVGAFSEDLWQETAEPLDGPTAAAVSEAARDAGVWLHAGSIVERDGADLYNTSLLFSPDGVLRASYRKIHRFGFDRGEAVAMSGGDRIVTAPLSVPAPAGTADAGEAPAGGGASPVLGLATCYDLRFPEQFRLLVDAGAGMMVVPAGWPARRRGHWTLLARARAVESQAYVLACCTAGTHAGIEQAGHSMVVDPWGEVLAEAGAGEQVLRADIDPSLVARTRADFPVLRDRVLGLPAPRPS